MPIPLKEGMKIYIQLANKNKIELGSIKALDTYEKFFVFYEKFIKTRRSFMHSYFESSFLFEEMPSFLKEKIEKINSPAELFVEDYKLGWLKPYNLYGKENLKSIL